MTATFNSPKIPIFFDAALYSIGVPSYIGWDTGNSTTSHILIAGGTGSGKSTHLMLLLAKISKYLPSARLFYMDFKGADELKYLRNVPDVRYYAHAECANGLQLFSTEIESRLQDNPDRTPLIAVFDEYASFASYTSIQDKKLAAQCQMWMMNALFMSRSVGGHCILCTQRPDQSIMPSGGARDQFGVRIWWGIFHSSEAPQMMFGDMYKQIPTSYVGGVGKGIAYIDGQGLIEVIAPRITNMNAVNNAILKLVTK